MGNLAIKVDTGRSSRFARSAVRTTASKQSSTVRSILYPGTKGRVQTKLRINTPGDAFEQEADRVAEQVMRMPDPRSSSSVGDASLHGNTTPHAGTIQRACKSCSADEELIQAKNTGASVPEVTPAINSGIQSLDAGGRSLSGAERSYFEPRFGRDFSNVRIHDNTGAASLARSVNARAFTYGHNVVMGAGEYSPDSRSGRKLLAHELTHVVQQRQSHLGIQRLSITQHALSKGTCGERNVQWVFSLDKAAPENGYIVQQIDKHEYIATCPDEAYGPPAPIHKFWEAWFVKKGDKVDWTTVRDKWTDGNTRPSRPGTNGSDIAGGIVKFFKKSTTGDLGDFNKAPADPKSPWGPGKVPNSGALPSTPNKPPWWGGSPVEGPAERGVWAWWNCCGGDKTKHSFDLKVKP